MSISTHTTQSQERAAEEARALAEEEAAKLAREEQVKSQHTFRKRKQYPLVTSCASPLVVALRHAINTSGCPINNRKRRRGGGRGVQNFEGGGGLEGVARVTVYFTTTAQALETESAWLARSLSALHASGFELCSSCGVLECFS